MREITLNPEFSMAWDIAITLNASDLRQSNEIPRYGPEYLYELNQKRAPMKVENGPTNDDLKVKPWHKAFGTEYHLIVEYTPMASDLEMVPRDGILSPANRDEI
jgi:hypothetical protein